MEMVKNLYLIQEIKKLLKHFIMNITLLFGQ